MITLQVRIREESGSLTVCYDGGHSDDCSPRERLVAEIFDQHIRQAQQKIESAMPHPVTFEGSAVERIRRRIFDEPE
jgi:hypothetical protein